MMPASPPRTPLDPRRIASALLAGWRTIALAVAVAVVAAAALWWATDDRRWEAEAVLALGRPGAALALDERLREPAVDPAFPYQVGSIRAYPELARMDAVARATRAELGARVPDGWTARRVARDVRVRAAADGTLLVVAARADTPEHAAALANAFAGTFSRLMDEIYDPAAADEPTTAILAARDAAGRDLAAAEDAVAAFHEAHDVAAREVEVAALSRRYDELLAAVDRLAAAERSVAALAATDGAREPGAVAAILELAALGGLGAADAPRFDLPGEALGDGPAVADLAAELAAVRAATVDAAAALPAALRTAQADLTRERALLARLERDRTLAEDRLTVLARRAAELDAERRTAQPELRVAVAAAAPTDPSLGGLWRVLLASVVLGAVAGAAVVLLRARGAAR